jgi:hypothetical protein
MEDANWLGEKDRLLEKANFLLDGGYILEKISPEELAKRIYVSEKIEEAKKLERARLDSIE